MRDKRRELLHDHLMRALGHPHSPALAGDGHPDMIRCEERFVSRWEAVLDDPSLPYPEAPNWLRRGKRYRPEQIAESLRCLLAEATPEPAPESPTEDETAGDGSESGAEREPETGDVHETDALPEPEVVEDGRCPAPKRRRRQPR